MRTDGDPRGDPAPTSPWRTFVAFPVASATRAGLAREVERLVRLDGRLRAVRPENLHVTVAFLGPTARDDVPSVVEALTEAARGVPPIEVRVAGVGAFPRAEAARVVWAGLTQGDARPLDALARSVGDLLWAAGFPVERDRFHAHVTLGRLSARSPSPALKKCLTEGHLQDTYTPETLSDLQLMISEPGSRYRPLATVALGSAA